MQAHNYWLGDVLFTENKTPQLHQNAVLLLQSKPLQLSSVFVHSNNIKEKRAFVQQGKAKIVCLALL